jgi:hypothetical protein
MPFQFLTVISYINASKHYVHIRIDVYLYYVSLEAMFVTLSNYPFRDNIIGLTSDYGNMQVHQLGHIIIVL